MPVCAALSERSTAFEERLTEMGTRMRVSYGAMERAGNRERERRACAVPMGIAAKCPKPKLDAPEVAKVAKIMVQAGYLGARAMHVFQLVRISSAIGVTSASARSERARWNGRARRTVS